MCLVTRASSSFPCPTGVGVSGVQWNPGSPELLAVVLSSGALYVLEVKEDVKVVASEVDMGAASCEWRVVVLGTV